MTSPILSIVIPMYNAERWIEPALRSTLSAAKAVSSEIIVVDDGSSDSGPQIVERVASSTFAKIEFVRHSKNIGIVKALNHGLDRARGRFVARMDADDMCSAQRFVRQISFLEETGVDICGCWFVEFGQGFPRSVHWPYTETAVRTSMLFQNSILHPSIVARRKVFDAYRYRDEYCLVEDYDLLVRALADCRMANVPENLLRYRRHPQQATRAKREAMETLTRRVRLQALASAGINPNQAEQEFHNAIRAPQSIRDIHTLLGIEAWLSKLIEKHYNNDARQVIAEQWVRACIRAAPLGNRMLQLFKRSPLTAIGDTRLSTRIDMAVLARAKLDYQSRVFGSLRRLGLSA